MRIGLSAVVFLSLYGGCGADMVSSGDGSTGNDAGAIGGDGSQPQNGSSGFPGSAIFYQDISNANVDSESTTIINALQARGWGDAPKRTKLGIDSSFVVLTAAENVTRRSFTQPADALPDCDTSPIPVPTGGRIEGFQDYVCADGGDCHLLVYQGTRLYELYQANITGGLAVGGTFTGSCLVVWDLTHDYWKPVVPYSRTDGCNGADAGDIPIAPLILKPDEITAKAINHALRFTIDNNRIRAGVYVHPATHIGGPAGGADTMPYGSRLRLRKDYVMASLPSDAARTVAVALQTYGMFMADGGNIYISATDDIADAISPSALGALEPKDFEMVDGGPRITWKSSDCTRTPITN